MKKIWKRIVKEAYGLAWTLAGTGLVLITLTGSIRDWGILISLIALAVHISALFIVPEDEL
jgi:hypothetical protein